MTTSSPLGDEPPYAGLTPECMLDALESVGFRGDGRFIALNSYENRVYQVALEDGGWVVAKFYRPQRWTNQQILEEHAFSCELDQAEIPVVAPLTLQGSTLAEHAGYRFAVFPRRGGRAPEIDDPEVLGWIGRFIGRIHAVGASAPFRHRPALDVESFGDEPRRWLLEHDVIPVELRTAWTAAVDAVLLRVRSGFERAAGVRSIRLHGDCHAANVLWTDAGPHFVDLDDARSGPAVQDLWMLLSGDHAERSAQLGALLRGYRAFADLDRRELALIEPLRSLRLIHYCAWIARRWSDPAFPAAFPWFGTQAYWQERILELREQLEAMDEPALEPEP